MTRKKMVCFDMDGTIADLYGVNGWLDMLIAEDVTPYEVAKPMWDMEKLANVLNRLVANNWEIRVITWLAKDSTEDYKNCVRIAKLDWLIRYNFPADKIHMVAYGTTKANTVRKYAEYAVLVDDNAQVRKGWTLGETINPENGNLIEELESLLK
jgi:hypothetical protein